MKKQLWILTIILFCGAVLYPQICPAPVTTSGGIWETNGDTAYYTTGSVGIGTSEPGVALAVDGSCSITNYLLINGGCTTGHLTVNGNCTVTTLTADTFTLINGINITGTYSTISGDLGIRGELTAETLTITNNIYASAFYRNGISICDTSWATLYIDADSGAGVEYVFPLPGIFYACTGTACINNSLSNVLTCGGDSILVGSAGAGEYIIQCDITMQENDDAIGELKTHLFINSDTVTRAGFHEKIALNEITSAGFFYFVYLNVGDIVDVRMTTDGADDKIDILNYKLTVAKR
jgi:hypothetical protein